MTARLLLGIVVLFTTSLVTACDDDDEVTPAVDAAVVDGDAPAVCEGGTLAYLATCTMDTECGTCSCEPFGHRSVCTKTCTGNEDCPAPSGGCSAGFCRP